MRPSLLHLAYFVSLSAVGFLLVISLPMRHSSIPRPSHLDSLFMSVSASTVSSMDSVEMESFSNSQLMVLTLLMLFGGEVFTSMLDLLYLNLINYKQNVNYSNSNNNNINYNQRELLVLELGMTSTAAAKPNEIVAAAEMRTLGSATKGVVGAGHRMRSSMKYLWYVVLGYLVLVHAIGCSMIMAYLTLVPAARAVLVQKGIRPDTFALFTTVSSFTNCGFIPTNENMEVFRTNPGLLTMVGALVLLGNTMYPIALRALVWVLRRMMSKKEELEAILSEDHEPFLMSGPESLMLGATVGGFILVQLLLFCCMEWGSAGLDGMSAYQKVVGSLFMSINARHAGESIVDLSAVSPAVLVLYAVMM